MNESDARILVASDSVDDAVLIKKLLEQEFRKVAISTNSERAVEDFEKQQPDVLILGFNTLEKAERYYLGLYRLSKLVHALPHQTLILCGKEDLQRVYELCKKQYFDDYVLFWPLTHDAPRLLMAVITALRRLDAEKSAPSTEMAAQARRLGELEKIVDQHGARGGQQAEMADRFVRRAEQDIGSALDSLSRKFADGKWPDVVDVKDSVAFKQEINRLKSEEIGRYFKSISEAVAPMRDWAGELKHSLGPQLESARALRSMVDKAAPLVLIVDDDEFQHKLLGQLLEELGLDLLFAASGMEALSLLRKRKPDLVMMDVGLPDVSGLEITCRIKSAPQYAETPVIMITGHSGKDVVMQSLQAGAADFVVKPFDKNVLLEKVRRFLPSGG